VSPAGNTMASPRAASKCISGWASSSRRVCPRQRQPARQARFPEEQAQALIDHHSHHQEKVTSTITLTKIESFAMAFSISNKNGRNYCRQECPGLQFTGASRHDGWLGSDDRSVLLERRQVGLDRVHDDAHAVDAGLPFPNLCLRMKLLAFDPFR